MTDKIFAAPAWPYVNGPLHLGHFAGTFVPCDIFIRYQRLVGNAVLAVTGSDTHGTPVTVTAEEEGRTPREVAEEYHALVIQSLARLGISLDLYTHTDTENHYRITQDFFLKLYRDGYIFKQSDPQLYDVDAARFLPDRYVEGECPICHYPRARGDQCENCGNLLDPLQLINPRSRLAKAGETHTLKVRETEHFYFDLPQFNKPLLDWAKRQTHWKPNVLSFTLNYLRGDGTDENPTGLKPRAITRDLDWGVPIPPEIGDYPNKRIYVWFDAVIGYYSASVEWSQVVAQNAYLDADARRLARSHDFDLSDAWKKWWTVPSPSPVGRGAGGEGDVRGYQFIGKDNIVFHTVIWPAMLLGYGDGKLPLPYDVPAQEFLNLEGRKFSKSAHWAVWVHEFLAAYDPDPLRYLLSVNMPEFADTDFKWSEFVRRNNDELVATWGNLANRALTFAYKNFDQRVPVPAALNDADKALIEKSEKALHVVGDAINACRFRDGIQHAFEVAREANFYLNQTEPWKTIKVDRARAGTSLYVALRVIDNLKTALYPYLPHSSADLHRQLGYAGDLAGTFEFRRFEEETRSHEALTYIAPTANARWAPSVLQGGELLGEPKALFKKLDESIVELETAKLGKPL
ncbi:MAG: methionine--tRNA ligase [Chloroflexi bacterium]|nr:methionine--tRNA ligase [Chloroflexota bacterium]